MTLHLVRKFVVTLWLCPLLLAAGPVPAGANALQPGILGVDDRQPVDSTEWPWSAIGRVNRANGGFCTGTLIAPRRVLTAAHCLFDSRVGRWISPRDLHFVAGYNRGTYVGHAVARTYRIDEAIATASEPDWPAEHDWAIIVLADDIPGAPIPWLAETPGRIAEAATDGSLSRAGYSRDRPHMLARHEGCLIEQISPDAALMMHRCDSTFGDSGSPMLLSRDGLPHVVGIHVAVTTSADLELGKAVSVWSIGSVLDEAAPQH